jgi:hypothetical protein
LPARRCSSASVKCSDLERFFRSPSLDGGDYPSHAAQEAAITGYVRWHNKHAQPERHFAIDSKIRRPEYLPDAA